MPSNRNHAATTIAVTKPVCIKKMCQNQKAAMNLLNWNFKENAATFVEASLHITTSIAEGVIFIECQARNKCWLKNFWWR
jgi:hypothetical protein